MTSLVGLIKHCHSHAFHIKAVLKVSFQLKGKMLGLYFSVLFFWLLLFLFLFTVSTCNAKLDPLQIKVNVGLMCI